jgi:hypothetical protein
MASEEPRTGAVLAGGQNGAHRLGPPIGAQGPAATQRLGGAAAGPWPGWAEEQLERAVALAATAGEQTSIAGLLYREWFSPVAGEVTALAADRPLAGLYRNAHAGSSGRRRQNGVSVVLRHDVIRVDGWWRTWGEDWTPPRGRRGAVRLLLTPRPECLAEFVTTATSRLLPERVPWSLGCATDPHRIARYGCAVLDLPSLDAVPDGMLAALEPLLRPVTSPLCLPVAPGIGAAEYPDNRMTFGEHRCHLVALALRHPSSAKHPLRSIAAVFAAHGVDPAEPHRAG